MKINQEMPKELDPYGKTALNKAEAGKSDRDRGVESSSPADTVNFSGEGKLRTDIYRTAMSAPDIRQEKVDRLKNMLAAGEYKIDSRDIAEKLIREETAIFAPQSL